MATYLATVQIGRYTLEPRRSPGVEWVVAYPPALARRVLHDFAPVGTMLERFQELFGPYPFPSYTVVVTEDPLEIPLEAQMRHHVEMTGHVLEAPGDFRALCPLHAVEGGDRQRKADCDRERHRPSPAGRSG